MASTPTAVSAPSRLAWVDVMKALGMFTIYLGHTGTGSGALFGVVYAFHVPMFFLLSGCFAPRSTQRPFWQAAWKRTTSLLLTYVLFTLLHFAVFLYMYRRKLTADVVQDWAHAALWSARGNVTAGALWFLPALWLMSMAYDIICRLARRVTAAHWTWVALGVAAVVHLVGLRTTTTMDSRFWSWNWALLYLIWYALGAVVFPWLNAWAARDGWVTRLAMAAILILSGWIVTCIYNDNRFFFLKNFSPKPRTMHWLILGINEFVLAAILSMGIYVIARLWSHSDLLRRMGRDVLLFCGMESAAKGILWESLYAIKQKYIIQSPAEAVVWSIALMGFVWVAFVPWVRPLVATMERWATPPAWRRPRA